MAYAFGDKYEEPCVKNWNKKKNLSQNLFIINILCAAYLCRKNVWLNNEKYQCAKKKIKIAVTFFVVV